MKLAQWIRTPFAQPKIEGTSVPTHAPLGSAARAEQLEAGAPNVRVCSGCGDVATVEGPWDVQVGECGGCARVGELRRMIDLGVGGAQGLSARTRVEALSALDALVRQDRARAVELAQVMAKGPRSQGRTVSFLVERARGWATV